MVEKKGIAVMISDAIGKILIALITTGIIAGVVFSADTKAEQAAMKAQLEPLTQAKLPERMSRLEQKVDDTKETTNNNSKKLDKILELMYKERRD